MPDEMHAWKMGTTCIGIECNDITTTTCIRPKAEVFLSATCFVICHVASTICAKWGWIRCRCYMRSPSQSDSGGLDHSEFKMTCTKLKSSRFGTSCTAWNCGKASMLSNWLHHSVCSQGFGLSHATSLVHKVAEVSHRKVVKWLGLLPRGRQGLLRSCGAETDNAQPCSAKLGVKITCKNILPMLQNVGLAFLTCCHGETKTVKRSSEESMANSKNKHSARRTLQILVEVKGGGCLLVFFFKTLTPTLKFRLHTCSIVLTKFLAAHLLHAVDCGLTPIPND